VHVRLLGPFEVVIGGAPLPLGSPQQRAVLAVLALRPGEVVATDALVEALWPRGAPATAVPVVRTYVSRLRQVLAAAGVEGGLVARPPGYVLAVDPGLVDARCFEQLVGRGRDELAAGRAEAAAATFRRALDLWRGDVLADLAWLEPVHAAAEPLRELRLTALEGRIDADLALGRHAEVVPELGALTGEHPFRERLWAQLMVALYRAGRQTEALAAYRQVRAAMVEQFGIEPGPELRDLERRVLCHATDLHVAEGAPAAPPLPAVLAHPVHERPFVGRAREWAVLAAALRDARSGHFGAVFLSGPPGIGKTALAARFARDAWAAGATVLLGRADEESPAPYHALREAVAHWWRHRSPGDPGRPDDDDLAVLAQAVPELGVAAARAPSDRLELFEAIGRWVGAAAGPAAPLVLVLDDLQWADRATLLAVRHLLRHPPSAGVLLLATHRDVDPRTDHPLVDLLAATHSDGHVRRVSLAGLDGAGVAALVAATARGASERPAGDSVDPAFAADVARATGGNPLFVHETVRSLTEQGAVVPRPAGWTSEVPLRDCGVPDGVKEVIEQRLRRLPEATAATLRQASVLGERFDLSLLGAVTEQLVADVVATVEPAVAAQLLRREPGADGVVAFAHALVRDALLDGVPSIQRAHAHWRAGTVLMTRGSVGRDRPLGEIARHLTAGVDAGDPQVAVEANVRAGQQALAALAFEDAAARFETAVALLDRTDRADPVLAYDAAFGLGQAGGALSDRDRQRTGFAHAAAVARAGGWADRLAHAAIGIVDYVSSASEVTMPGDTRRSDQALAQELLDDALARIGDEPTADRLLLLTHQATRAMTLSRPAEARAFADAALATAHGLDDPAAVPFALVARLWTMLGRPCDASLRDAPGKALAFSAPPQTRTSLRVFIVPMLPIVALHLGDRAGLDTVRARVAADPVTRGSAHLTGYVRTWDAAVALCEGRLGEAEEIAAALRTTSEGNLWNGIAAMQAVSVSIERGDPHVTALLSAYLAFAPGSLVARAMLASVHAADGAAGAAAEQIAAVRDRHELQDLDWAAPLVLRHFAETAARLDDASLAADLLPVLEPYGGQMLVPFHGATVEAAADRAIGQVLSVLGRHDEAVARLRSAHVLEAGFGAPALVARTTYWLARAQLARGAPGDRDSGRRLLHDAAGSTGRFGMARLRQDIGSLA
jgi:DNA-binding SARP family transcriptional activator